LLADVYDERDGVFVPRLRQATGRDHLHEEVVRLKLLASTTPCPRSLRLT
jgi:hypothetical protein